MLSQLSTKDAYWGKHCAKAGAIGKNNGGAHWEYLARMLRASKSGYAAGGSGMTVADIALWELCDLHMRIWPKEMAAEYPELAAHHAKVAAVPGVKAYLEGPQRLEKVNNNGFG